jgi:hypothetical protein
MNCDRYVVANQISLINCRRPVVIAQHVDE